jgi:glucuronate isomerase
MSQSTRDSIYEAIASIRLVDPHTHINPHNPGSQTLADILGYHYYTELVHSAGMPKARIEEDGITPRELVGRLVEGLPNIENTANYQWLINICKTFFDFDEDRITQSNWESLFDTAEERMSSAEWPQMVLDKSNVEAVFLTNDFDDALEGFDTNTYIPCLRTDDLVFHLGKSETRERLAACSGIEIDGSLENLRAALRQRFEHFVPRGARACAISIPPDFEPGQVADGRAETALEAILKKGVDADPSHHVALSRRVFWTLAELCDEFSLPFDLMIGVNRGVYPSGVYQGQDLYDSRVSLTQYRQLFNAFPDVKFPISVLASVTNQELVSHAWIFPNVFTNGHWWYSNTPSFIARDAAARLEAVPRNKQIGYYSDAYKLEFVWPKFDMYRNILADILADYFVGDCGWDEERAIELGHQVLRGNVDTLFPRRGEDGGSHVDGVDDPIEVIPGGDDLAAGMEDSGVGAVGAVAGASAALAAGAIGMVEVSDAMEVSGVHEVPVGGGPFVGAEDGAAEDGAAEDGAAEDGAVEDAGQAIGADFASELYETVDEVEDIADVAEPEFDVVEAGEAEDLDIDPTPSDDEIQSAEVEDVLFDDPNEPELDAAAIEGQADGEPLDVGNLLDESDLLTDSVATQDESGDDVNLQEEPESPQIDLLRGEEGFTPDEDSLQLTKDPVTGELTFGQTEDEIEVDLIDGEDPDADNEATVELDASFADTLQAEVEAEMDSEIDLLEFDDEETSP